MPQPNRREFLGAAAGGAAFAAPARNYRKPGCFTVDCQSHIFVPELVEWMQKRKEPPYAYRQGGHTYVVVGKWRRRLREKHMDIEAKLADMDEAGIDVTALSINDPGPELFGKDGMSVARLVNDYVGEIARKHPKRFVGLFVLPLQDVDASLRELERCVERLGMKGMLLYSNLNGSFPDEPRFHPVFQEARRRGLPILLHPAYPVTYEATRGYNMTAGLGLMFDTTIALARIILAGILEELPDLKLVCPHVGGTLPYLIGRIDHQTQVLKRGAENIRKPPSQYLKQVYLDAVSPLPLAIRYGIDFAGADHMLYSSDHPWVDPKSIVRHIQSLELPAADELAIFGGNARRLFGL